MKKEIDITKNVLRGIEESYRFYEMYFLPDCEKDILKWFVGCLCEEASFLNADKQYIFKDRIMKLSKLCNIELSENQIIILSDLIGNFRHQFNIPVPVEKLYTIDSLIILEIVNLLISGDAKLDTHIAVRNDLVLYESIHSILPYKLYKKLVFSTVCKTTSCSDGAFNPMEKVKNNLWLKNSDYKKLCSEIFK